MNPRKPPRRANEPSTATSGKTPARVAKLLHELPSIEHVDVATSQVKPQPGNAPQTSDDATAEKWWREQRPPHWQ